MAEKKNILTYTGLKKYEDELHDLKVNKRQEIAQKIKEAREQGGLEVREGCWCCGVRMFRCLNAAVFGCFSV